LWVQKGVKLLFLPCPTTPSRSGTQLTPPNPFFYVFGSACCVLQRAGGKCLLRGSNKHMHNDTYYIKLLWCQTPLQKPTTKQHRCYKQHAEPALSFSSSVSWASEKGLWCLARLGLAVSIVSLSKAHIKVPSVPVSRCRLCYAHQAPPQHGVNGRKSKFSKTTTAAIDAPTAEDTHRSTAVPSGLPPCLREEA
jgi:hypothetical protein